MQPETNCLIQIDSDNDICFIGFHGEYTPDLQKAMIYKTELDAITYIDKHGLDRLATIRHITRLEP